MCRLGLPGAGSLGQGFRRVHPQISDGEGASLHCTCVFGHFSGSLSLLSFSKEFCYRDKAKSPVRWCPWGLKPCLFRAPQLWPWVSKGHGILLIDSQGLSGGGGKKEWAHRFLWEERGAGGEVRVQIRMSVRGTKKTIHIVPPIWGSPGWAYMFSLGPWVDHILCGWHWGYKDE